MISNNYQNQLNYGAVKDVVPQKVNERLPQNVQNFDVKDKVGENTVVKAAQDAKTDPVTIGLTGAIWLAFAQGCQYLNNKLNADWENSWLGKIGQKFDNLALKHIKTKEAGKIKKGISNLFDKSKILRSLKTPTKAQNSLAVSQARGITGYVMSDVSSMLGYHLKNGNGDDILNLVKELKPDLKDGKEALSYIDDLFKNCEDNMPQIKKLVQNLSASDAKVSVDNLVKGKIPFINKDFRIPNIPFLKRKGSFKEMANKLNAVFSDKTLAKQTTKLGKAAPKQALKTLEGLTNGGAGGKLMIVIQASIFAQAIRKAMDAPEGEKLSTFTENIANDFGFFLSLPFQVKSSHLVGGLKYIGIGGAKNTQEQVKNVAKYRDMIKNLNQKVSKGTISKIDYAKEASNIKNFLKGDSKWYHKPFKALGKLFSTGLDAETIKPFIDANDKTLGTSIYNSVRNLANKIKGPGLGTVLRLAVGTMIIGPMIAKATTKVSHLIFGRPSKSVLDKEEENKTTEQQNSSNNPFNISEQELQQKLLSNPELMQKLQSNPEILNSLLSNPELFMKVLNGEVKVDDLVKNTQNSEILNSKYIKPANQTTQNQTPQQTTTQIPPQAPVNQSGLNALDNGSTSKMDLFGLGKKDKEETKETTENKDPLEPQRSYIPSSECTIGKTDGKDTQELDPEVNNALLKAQKAEEQALKQLNNL